jgi:putative phosphoribosyl transferase
MWPREPKYRDREEAGRVLAPRLDAYRGKDALVLAIPNGGVAVGASIAESLGLELHLLIVRKIQFPDNPEAGFGAVGSDGTVVLDERLLGHMHLSPEQVDAQKEKALRSVRERLIRFGDRARLPVLRDRTVILVDDGLASGSTMEAAVYIVRAHKPKQLVVAVPTTSRSAYQRIKPLVDYLACPDVSRLPVFAVADAYERWYDVDEEEVVQLMDSLSVVKRARTVDIQK